MLRRIEFTRERLWMGRGSQGHTTQAVTAKRTVGGVDISFVRVGGESLAIHLDPEELDALVAWLVAREEQQSSYR